MEKNNKNIRISGNEWNIRAIAISVPGCDIDVTVNIKKKMTTNEANAYAEELKSKVEGWFEESRVMSPKHFILHIAHPTYPVPTRVMSMSLQIEISVMTRAQIQLGDTSFKSIFKCELERLIEELALEK